MANDLTDEQHRALRLLARTPKGYTKAVLMAHGFPTEMLEKLVMAGLAGSLVGGNHLASARPKPVAT
jgi:hypothetical protein